MSTRPERKEATGGLDTFGNHSTLVSSGWGTGPLDLSASVPGSDDQSGRDARAVVDPAIFGIDAADVGKEPTPAESDQIESFAKIIESSFIWYAIEADTKLDALRRDLKKVDPPHWSQQVASFVLESALAAGAQASGLALAAKLVTGEASREFLQNLFASGVTGGIAAGQAKLSGGSDDTVVDTFMDSQKEGVTKRQQGSQSEFILNGRQQLKSVAQARDLAAACDNGNAKAAAAHQYAASRDAWVSYLAQQKFGAVSSRLGPLPTAGTRAPGVDIGDVTTNNEQPVVARCGSRSPGRTRVHPRGCT